ncbi:hypothetical protein [Sphaerisporangium fuscum]|uniref:hypothetical protein n=1 Tax=Sphaerisporangium fuscum TaxID=2835868 RepID=UPI001BDCA6BE|nr:hypothetical protein [Sphaerisporangium fuscum]
MGKLRPRLVAPVLTAVLAMSAAACGGGGASTPGASGEPAEKIKVTVALFSDFHFAPLWCPPSSGSSRCTC